MRKLKWKKLGIVYAPDGNKPWAKSHAAVPTPYVLNSEIIRVYLTSLDSNGRGRPGYVDISASNPCNVLYVSESPILEIGEKGCFDDNGVMPVCVMEPKPGILFMYYVGFELSHHIPYRIFTGLAISENGGTTFKRHSRVPILDRTDDERYFRCGPFVLLDGGLFKLWYIAGSEWTEIGGKTLPCYDLRYQESQDGIHWASKGKISMEVTNADEHGFGRPWVIKQGPNNYQLFYSIRSRSLAAYRLGYAESKNGIDWIRKDNKMGLDVTPNEFDSNAIMYSSVISVGGNTYCFYNGDNSGKFGFGVAVLETD